MKKLRLFVLFFLMAIIFSACQSNEVKKSIITNFNADFTASKGDFSAGGSITANDGQTELVFNKPQTVDGLKIGNDGGEISIEIDDLTSTADEAYLPNEIFCNLYIVLQQRFVTGEKFFIKKIMNPIHIYWKLQRANAHIP